MVNETAGMQSVGTPGELRRALTLVETARPDAVVVELGSGRAATLNACRDLRRRYPRVTIVALGTSEDPAVVNEALAAGVRGYLMINTSPTLLGWAILAARAGRTVVDPQIRRVEPSAAPAAKPFTPERSEEHTSELQSRQYLVCRLLLEKKNNTAVHPYRETL